MSQTTGNLYIARTNASDLGNYSCLATSHMDFSTKSVFSKFAQLNLAAEGQGRRAGRAERVEGQGVWGQGFPSEVVGLGPRPPGPPATRPQPLGPGPHGERDLGWSQR